ncbi:NUDIX hydrolase [Fictibacillus phosphorivorans]|uniref:NUDIX hydrolase n=1 Tax=Fictibacillus phosphorivorans TaxID=1221500 RepID=UPI003CF58928
MFNEWFGQSNIDENKTKINHREAVRAIIIEDNQILMVHSNLGDFKFPGGGVEDHESHAEGLIREVAEETGFFSIVGDKMGVVIERHLDDYDEEAIFQMTSHYYLCELMGEEVVQQLDDYEFEQEYTPKWVDLDEAIKQNQGIINQCEENVWIHRENFVLKELKKSWCRSKYNKEKKENGSSIEMIRRKYRCNIKNDQTLFDRFNHSFFYNV